MRVWVPREGIIPVSGGTGPVWRDADGNICDTWEDLSVDHLKNVVVLLTKRVQEAQKEFKKLPRDKYTNDWAYPAAFQAEERWRELLLLLEGASSTLRRRLAADVSWELDPAPKTPQEVLTRAGRVLGEAPRRVGRQRGGLVSPAGPVKEGKVVEGKIVERPRKLRIIQEEGGRT